MVAGISCIVILLAVPCQLKKFVRVKNVMQFESVVNAIFGLHFQWSTF